MKCLNVGEQPYEAGARATAFFPARKLLCTAVAAAAGLASHAALALGLGEMQSQTYLGQPLQARVELVGPDIDLDSGSVQVRRVGADEAADMGAEVYYGAHQFDIVIHSGNTPYVSIRTREPVKEPYLSLLLELKWPSGAVIREYPVLLDPAPIVAAPTSERTEPARAPAAEQVSSNATPRSDSRAVTLKALETAGGKYTVQRGDTLSRIAERWREGSDQSIQETTQWLYENNPGAFIDDDINRLIAGATLQMPALTRVSVEPGASAAGAPVTSNAPGADSGTVSGSEAQAAPAADTSANQADAVSSEELQGLLTVGANESSQKTRELIDMLTRENQMLRSRMEKVEGSNYITTMRELVLLQQEQIRELQKQLGEPAPRAEQVEQMLEEIGLDEPADIARASATAVEGEQAESVQDAVRESAEPATQSESPEQTPLVELDKSGTEALVERAKDRSRLISLLLVIGGLLLAGFAAMYYYFRKMTSPPEPAQTLSPATARAASEPQPRARNIPLKPEKKKESLSEEEIIERHLSDQQQVKPSQAGSDDEYPEDFAGLDLDEELLGDLNTGSTDEPLEALTEPLPSGQKPPRRSDDEVKSSIAEKMSHYRSDASPGNDDWVGLELDELDGLDSSGYDDVETIVYRALMYCEFRKFDKARHVLEVKMETETDTRLREALQQVEALERDAIKRSGGE